MSKQAWEGSSPLAQLWQLQLMLARYAESPQRVSVGIKLGITPIEGVIVNLRGSHQGNPNCAAITGPVAINIASL